MVTCGKEECLLPAQFVISPANSRAEMSYHVCANDLAEGIRLMIDQDSEGIVLACLEGEDT